MKLFSRKNNKPLEEYLLSNNIIKRGSHIALAVSGGADSVAMLLFFLSVKEKLGLELCVYHMEHGIRGEESVCDADFVQDLCESFKVEFHIRSVNVLEYAGEFGLSTEEAARKLRYEFLMTAKEEYVAVAHNYEDNAETVLFNLIRGTGISGLCGMEEIRPLGEDSDKMLIRPLLTVRRADILKFLSYNNQSFRTDSTNANEEYSRNALRNSVFPKLLEINSKAVLHINEAAESLREIKIHEDKKALESLREISKGDEISADGLLTLEPLLRRNVIIAWLDANVGKKDLYRSHYEAVESLLSSRVGKRVDIPGATVIRGYEKLFIEKNYNSIESQMSLVDNKEPDGSVDINMQELMDRGNLVFKWGEFVFELNTFLYKKDSKIPGQLYTKWFDCDKIGHIFSLRGEEDGDYFTINSSLNKKPYNRFCIDEKIPLAERSKVPLFVADNHIIWAVGYRVSEAFKVDSNTRTILEISVREKQND